MANCYGGVILLGVIEREDGSFATTGLKDIEKLKKDFGNVINDRKKVSINLLTDEDVEAYEIHDDVVMAIHVPQATREEKPVYLNDNLFGGTFRRNGAVSYTHLDVYKRQASACLIRRSGLSVRCGGEYDKEQKRYQSFALPCASFFLFFSGNRKRSGNLQRTGAEH